MSDGSHMYMAALFYSPVDFTDMSHRYNYKSFPCGTSYHNLRNIRSVTNQKTNKTYVIFFVHSRHATVRSPLYDSYNSIKVNIKYLYCAPLQHLLWSVSFLHHQLKILLLGCLLCLPNQIKNIRQKPKRKAT